MFAFPNPLFLFSDSPNQAGPSGMSSTTGAVGHAGAAQAPAASTATAASANGATLLWAKTQQLPEEAFRQLHSIYGDHFPLEARHHLAGN